MYTARLQATAQNIGSTCTFNYLGFSEGCSTGVLSRFNHKSLMYCLQYLSGGSYLGSTSHIMQTCSLPIAMIKSPNPAALGQVCDLFFTAVLSQLMIDLPEAGTQEASLQEMGM